MSDERIGSRAGRHRAAVLGSPIDHSLSPALHRAAYRSLGLEWTYEPYDVDAKALPSFLAGLDATWAGLSLTMPLKQVVISLLDEVDPEAVQLASVNTVLPHPGGGWRGTNTDVYGMVESLSQAGLGSVPGTATILGAGATARSAIAALARLGCSQVAVCARRPEAVEGLSELAEQFGLSAQCSDLTPNAELIGADLIVSTLPGDAAAPWTELAGGARGALLDVSYHPWPTPLAAAWGGSVIASGRDMLLWQAVEQVRLMTGEEPSVAAMRQALPSDPAARPA